MLAAVIAKSLEAAELVDEVVPEEEEEEEEAVNMTLPSAERCKEQLQQQHRVAPLVPPPLRNQQKLQLKSLQSLKTLPPPPPTRRPPGTSPPRGGTTA